MLYPSINLLRTKVDSKYTLVAMASKRARDIIDGKPVLVDDPAINKPVSIATEEIAEDKITYSRSFKRVSTCFMENNSTKSITNNNWHFS